MSGQLLRMSTVQTDKHMHTLTSVATQIASHRVCVSSVGVGETAGVIRKVLWARRGSSSSFDASVPQHPSSLLI